MSKVIEWDVVCPGCGYLQSYHSHKAQVKGKRRKSCEKCGRSFKAKEQRLSNVPEKKRELREEKEEKGTHFHKYSRSD